MLEIKNVSKQYRGEDKLLCDAVSDVSLSMEDHRIYALVGESGCGKSTLSRLILGLESPSSGQILLDGKAISRKGAKRRKETAKAIQLVLQDGKSALDPHFTVYQAIAEPIRNLLSVPKEKERARIFELLDRMGLPKETANKKTGELSGGQQKRVGIARALAVKPEFIVCDEPISALDVSIQSQIVNMLEDMQQELGLSTLLGFGLTTDLADPSRKTTAFSLIGAGMGKDFYTNGTDAQKAAYSTFSPRC